MAENKQTKKRPNKLTEMINPKTDGNSHLAIEDNFDDEGNPMIGRRIIVKDDKPVFETRSFDPTGFWKVVALKGTVPKELSGVYTTQLNAQRAIDAYLSVSQE